MIRTLNPWYGDIIVYLQMSSFLPDLSMHVRQRIHHHSQPHHIIGYTLYHVGADSIRQTYEQGNLEP